jgi:hypothetical protein
MTDIDQLSKQGDRTFILVCANFIMLFVLFCGLGYVIWRSAILIGEVQYELQKAERGVADMRNRIQDLDVDVMMQRLLGNATEAIPGSVATAIQQSDFAASVRNLSARVENTHDRLERTGASIRAIRDELPKIDTEELARLVSYQMLKGLGEGLNRAAETRKPGSGG